jgi:uncharacterized membrane protein YidH (DUF202 family)
LCRRGISFKITAIKKLLSPIFSLGGWLINLFDPPPLSSMNLRQKTGRVILLSATLVIGSILVAMLGALGLYLMERGRELGSTPEFFNGVAIIFVGVGVNAVCFLVLIQIKKADTKLVPPKK